jgi:thioredoxin-like negative regulator of GroEL
MAPVFGRLSKVYKGRIAFVAVNAYDRPDMAKRFGVRATPTFILMRKGKALRHFYGNVPEPLLKQHLAPYAPPPGENADDDEGGGVLSRVLRLFRGN